MPRETVAMLKVQLAAEEEKHATTRRELYRFNEQLKELQTRLDAALLEKRDAKLSAERHQGYIDRVREGDPPKTVVVNVPSGFPFDGETLMRAMRAVSSEPWRFQG